VCQPQCAKIISFMYDAGIAPVYNEGIICAFAYGLKVLRTRIRDPKPGLRTSTYENARKGAESLGFIFVRVRT
jgi:hypothetical protein